jgi:hypothetical protein
MEIGHFVYGGSVVYETAFLIDPRKGHGAVWELDRVAYESTV